MESIRMRRKAKGLTQKQLAIKSGVTESQISQIETGKRKPGFETLLRISEALDCTTDDLVRNKKNPATEGDGVEESIDLSQLSEDRKKLIQDILKASDQDVSFVLQMTERLLSDR